MKKNFYFNESNPDTKTTINSSKKWSVGVIKQWDFHNFQEYLSTESEEKIYKLFLKDGSLNVKRCEKVTVFMPESLPNGLKFYPNIDNRFVFCA
uniref:Uncharacterized protein n=1 Tax=Panagrolaimus sp. PS1159 TaxID=55785 RepID=A0AC35F1N7_9BILA